MSNKRYTVRINLSNYRQQVRHVVAPSPKAAVQKVAREVGLHVKVHETPEWKDDE